MDILAIGELLMDMTPVKSNGKQAFLPNPGGAPPNMLAMAQSMGSKTGFIGQVGDDSFGHTLKETLEGVGIDTFNLMQSSEYPTTLAFVHLTDAGERSFSFYRKACADVQLQIKDIDMAYFDQSKLLHFGSLSFTDEPIKSTVLDLLEKAKTAHKYITYDPNYRPALWEDESLAVENMLLGFSYADIVKVSDEEAILLSGEKTIEAAGKKLLEMGPQLICITLGSDGVYYCHRNFSGYVSGYPAQVVDTTGAGDAFFGAFISQLLANDMIIEETSIINFLKIANAAASLVVEAYGGIPSIPTKEAVLKRFKNSLK